MNTFAKAYLFAQKAHKKQTRKYTQEPYFNHPLKVACIVSQVIENDEVWAAALLHDVVEDTPATLGQIKQLFGQEIESLVAHLTNTSTLADGCRKIRKEIDRRQIAGASPEAKTIKIADRIDNLGSVVRHDPKFAKTYLAESKKLLDVLKDGDLSLWIQLDTLIKRSEPKIFG